ncbi:hypothetical protein J4573_50775 [Actinomadura barringtoniae]|uniref:XRE family transcriptional regulator n=1 Tax=Actinomadura barringtoniae TaxID=1427535 RepID=A0A939PM30_9ACTN|nr:hypothetical protein [Actinomadura barringtoniae]MBO2455442.1 hypothetical protein [Actinomadura barringtoniae]
MADDSARFARRVRRLDETTMEQLDADVARLAEDYLRRPLINTFRRVAELRGDVFGMLDERHPLDQEHALYLVAGRLCALLAHASADLGHPNEADTHARTALVCAELINDDPLRAYTRWVQSLIAYWRGDYRTAATIAQRARDHATSGTALLRLASQEARALAAAGQESEFTQAAALAQTARDSAVSEPASEAGVFRFAPGKAAYYAAEAHTAVGTSEHLARAVAEADEAIALLTAEPVVSSELVAAARLDLATAYIARGDLDGAAEPFRQVLDIPPQHRTIPIVGRVLAAARKLTVTDAPVAADLIAEAEVFAAYQAAPPELPSAS